MMRNKSIVPPNRGIKTYPQGSKGTVIDLIGICTCKDKMSNKRHRYHHERRGKLVRKMATH